MGWSKANKNFQEIIMKQVPTASRNLHFFSRKQAEKILQYFLMPFKEVPKEFNEKLMGSKEEKIRKMEENELRIYSHGIKSISIEKILSNPPVGIR